MHAGGYCIAVLITEWRRAEYFQLAVPPSVSEEVYISPCYNNLSPYSLPLQSLEALLKTLLELCHKDTTVIMSYEERSTGDKPQIENHFFQVRTCMVMY